MYFDKRVRSFMSRTAITLKFQMRWFPEKAGYSLEKKYTDINLPYLWSNEYKNIIGSLIFDLRKRWRHVQAKNWLQFLSSQLSHLPLRQWRLHWYGEAHKGEGSDHLQVLRYLHGSYSTKNVAHIDMIPVDSTGLNASWMNTLSFTLFMPTLTFSYSPYRQAIMNKSITGISFNTYNLALFVKSLSCFPMALGLLLLSTVKTRRCTVGE